MNNDPVNMYVHIFVWISVSLPLEQIPRSGTAVPHGKFMFNILRNCQTLFKVVAHLKFPPAMYNISNFFILLPALGIA